ncbi:MAG: hypothetical protein AB4063_07685 [Crocosphaera sp.]
MNKMKRQFDYLDELDYRLGQELDPIWKTSDGQEKHLSELSDQDLINIKNRLQKVIDNTIDDEENIDDLYYIICADSKLLARKVWREQGKKDALNGLQAMFPENKFYLDGFNQACKST